MTPRLHKLPYSRSVKTRRALGLPIRKTFAIGFNKMGTSSLHDLFNWLGYRSEHSVEWHDLSRDDIFAGADCFSDGFPEDWKELDRRWPDARFVLQVRKCEEWIVSRLKHVARVKAAGTWRGGESWGIWDETEEAVAAWIALFHTHHVDVLQHFRDRPGKLLVLNYIDDPDAALKLARFMGYRGPIEKSKKNVGRSTPAPEHTEMIAAACARLGLDRADLQSDLLLPAAHEIALRRAAAVAA